MIPRARWRIGLLDNLSLRLGLEGGFTAYQDGTGMAPSSSNQRLQSAAALADLPWWPRANLQVVLGLRVDR